MEITAFQLVLAHAEYAAAFAITLPFDFEKDLTSAMAVIGVLLINDLTLKTHAFEPGIESQPGGTLVNVCGSRLTYHLMDIAF